MTGILGHVQSRMPVFSKRKTIMPASQISRQRKWMKEREMNLEISSPSENRSLEFMKRTKERLRGMGEGGKRKCRRARWKNLNG